MYELNQSYLESLENLALEIQESEELANYLESEEEEDYTRIKELFEPKIARIYDEVARENPLQLIALELVILDDAFEGLYLPKILGYSVLRGDINENYKYTRPQEHFKEVLMAICNSSNFDILKKRIGQSIQMGFALSSDIWVTNLINDISNKRIRYFLQGQKLDRYRQLKERKIGYHRYLRQFKTENFQTAEFPEDLPSLKILFPALKNFLIHRIKIKGQNESIIPAIKAFLENKELQLTNEYLQVITLYANFFDLEQKDQKHLNKYFNQLRKKYSAVNDEFLGFQLEMYGDPEIDLGPEADKRMIEVLDDSIKDEITDLYQLKAIIHSKGYLHEETHEAVKVFYSKYPGRSVVNKCVRLTIFQYFKKLINNLTTEQYAELFEISKLFPVYMQIFANEEFNQDLKVLCLRYIKKLLKVYTDKRGRDYQDIKKFVAASFPGFGFLKDKEVVELFKTRRKKKPAASE